MSVKYYSPKSSAEYTVSYKNMRGVDFTSESNSPTSKRFSYLENMYRDYEGDGGEIIESIPGFRRIAKTLGGKKVHSIFSQKSDTGADYIIVHAGDCLFRFKLDMRDKLTTLEPIGTVNDTKSRAFNFGTSLYILDGLTITIIDGEGTVSKLEENSYLPYVPTTYVNGEEYEQRNLLSPYFYEKSVIGNSDGYASATDGIEYEIFSELEKTAVVKGGAFPPSTSLYIPSRIKIADSYYKIIGIAREAFYMNHNIVNVTVAEGVEKIGKLAFAACQNLNSVILPESISEIGDLAFANCGSLVSLNFGRGISQIGSDIFLGSENLASVKYSGSNEDFGKVDSKTSFETVSVICESENKSIRISIRIYSPAVSVSSVKIGGVAYPFTPTYSDGLVKEVTLFEENKNTLNGKEVIIEGVMDETRYTASKHASAYHAEFGIAGSDAIKKCTVCESFDGRIFVSGNPDLPNTVFFTQRARNGQNHPLYFGALNYFNDGIGTYKVTSLLSTSDSIAVFKEGDDTGGSIYYHKPKETGIDVLPKVYPVSYIHSGISSIGETISFFDEPIFLTHLGVCTVKPLDYSDSRSVRVTSHNVNPKLLCENISKISLARWRGYLVVSAGERIYLADSRQTFRHSSGNYEYEWYFLNGIGTYTDDKPVYRYASNKLSSCKIYHKPDEIAGGMVRSSIDNDGNLYYFTIVGTGLYGIYKTEERRGGVFHPLSAIYSHEDELLFFGTENGDICLFNSDMRGVPPERISSQEGFDIEEYKKSYGAKIHSDFYDFASHAPSYVVRSVMDDCAIPNLTKSTVKNSLTSKIRVYSHLDLSVEVKTDKSDYTEKMKIPDTLVDFDDLDFSSFSFVHTDYSNIAIREKEKGWIEKQLQVSTDKFRAPFGLCSQSYRFTVKGRIKNT